MLHTAAVLVLVLAPVLGAARTGSRQAADTAPVCRGVANHAYAHLWQGLRRRKKELEGGGSKVAVDAGAAKAGA